MAPRIGGARAQYEPVSGLAGVERALRQLNALATRMNESLQLEEVLSRWWG